MRIGIQGECFGMHKQLGKIEDVSASLLLFGYEYIFMFVCFPCVSGAPVKVTCSAALMKREKNIIVAPAEPTAFG